MNLAEWYRYMQKPWRFLISILLLGLIGCSDGVTGTPTPFASVSPALTQIDISNPTSILLSDLAADPAAYEGELLQLSGQYRRLPLLVCEGKSYSSPATWGVVADEVMAQAGGLAELRSMLPENLTITIEGRWRHWKGPVGCGKRAIVQEIWYLDVSRILSPSPLTNATLTPAAPAGATVIAQIVPIATAPEGGAPPLESSPTSLAQPTVEEEEVPPPGATVALPTSSPTVGGGAPATVVATVPTDPTEGTIPALATTPAATVAVGTPTQEGGEGTPQATAPAGTTAPGTPTATLSPLSTPTPTGTASSFVLIDQGTVDQQELVGERLGNNELHSWSFTITGTNAVTVSVAAINADIIVSIVDASENSLIEQNSAPVNPAGQIEVITGLQLQAAGTYDIRIRTATGAPTSYVMMPLYSQSYPFVFRGILTYGNSQSTQLAANTDHFWHFGGAAGENITISVTPSGNTTDLFLELYDPFGSNISDFTDLTGGGEIEVLEFTLPEAGIYSIRVGELDYRPAQYRIDVTN